jgi:hypothetical protein
VGTAYRSLDSDYTFLSEHLFLSILQLSFCSLHTAFWVTSSIAACPEPISAAEHFEHHSSGTTRYRKLVSSHDIFYRCIQIENRGGNNISHAGLGVMFFLQMSKAAAAAEISS